MQILGNIFNAIIFVSAIGGIFCVLSLFINHILRCTLPLWFPLCGMILFCVPFLSPDVFLISPETQEWLNGFYIACWVWVCGCGILFVYDTLELIRSLFRSGSNTTAALSYNNFHISTSFYSFLAL